MKRIVLFLALSLFLPHAAFAACASPTAEAGALNWNGSAFQYCDGTTWQSFAGGGGSYDTTPDAFNFTNLTGQNLNATSTSNTLTITGLTTTIPVLATVSGSGSPQISVGGGAWATSAVLFNGQTIAVRHTTPTTATTARTSTVTIGSGSTTWQTTTVGVTPGSQNFTTVGNGQSFTVPAYNNLTVTVKGGGSGGSGGNTTYPCGYSWCSSSAGSGGTGGTSRFNSNLIGNGGTFSAQGTGSGGTTNTTGGGSAAGGGGSAGCMPWGYGSTCGSAGSAGKAGGLASKTYNSSELTGGSTITVDVGGGGSGGGGGCHTYGYSTYCGGSGGAGTAGRVEITWN